jgi:hypothetical protein
MYQVLSKKKNSNRRNNLFNSLISMLTLSPDRCRFLLYTPNPSFPHRSSLFKLETVRPLLDRGKNMYSVNYVTGLSECHPPNDVAIHSAGLLQTTLRYNISTSICMHSDHSVFFLVNNSSRYVYQKVCLTSRTTYQLVSTHHLQRKNGIGCWNFFVRNSYTVIVLTPLEIWGLLHHCY